MCGIVKKVIVVSALATGGLFALNHVWSGSVNTAWKRATARFERSIDPDFELARIRDEIVKLTPDMHKNIARIAEEMVAVESLDRKVTDMQARLESAKDDLALITNAVEKGATRVSINGREIPVNQIKDRLRTCKTLERELANNKKVLDAKKAGVDAARQQLVEMREQKAQLEVMAAEYESQLKTLALEKTRSRIKLDDSRLAEIKASMEKLRERIETERKTALLAEEFNGGKPVEATKVESNKEIVDQAKEYLAPKEKAEAVKN
jgi:DNA repair exonuclease SbcCD ATPase subunit